jgi:hypothetical protein
MDNNEILLKSLSLLEAIYEDNLEEAKVLVEYLNDNFKPNNNFLYLNELLPLELIVNNIKNNTILYVLNNLNNVSKNIDELRWNINTINLL